MASKEQSCQGKRAGRYGHGDSVVIGPRDIYRYGAHDLYSLSGGGARTPQSAFAGSDFRVSTIDGAFGSDSIGIRKCLHLRVLATPVSDQCQRGVG